MRRFSEMKNAEEPLEEEVVGICLLCAVCGLLCGHAVFGSTLLGGFVFAQFGPVLSLLDGAIGESARATGWSVSAGLDRTLAEAERRGWMQRATAASERLMLQWRAFDEHTGSTRRARAAA